MKLKTRQDGRRTLVFDDDDLHVGTIWEGASEKEMRASGSKSGGYYRWITRNNSGQATSKEEGLRLIEKDLAR